MRIHIAQGKYLINKDWCGWRPGQGRGGANICNLNEGKLRSYVEWIIHANFI